MVYKMCSPDHLADIDVLDKAVVMRLFVQDISRLVLKLFSFPRYCRNLIWRSN